LKNKKSLSCHHLEIFSWGECCFFQDAILAKLKVFVEEEPTKNITILVELKLATTNFS